MSFWDKNPCKKALLPWVSYHDYGQHYSGIQKWRRNKRKRLLFNRTGTTNSQSWHLISSQRHRFQSDAKECGHSGFLVGLRVVSMPLLEHPVCDFETKMDWAEERRSGRKNKYPANSSTVLQRKFYCFSGKQSCQVKMMKYQGTVDVHCVIVYYR